MPATLPPLALYVHLPWCVRKCPYCDFNSYAAPATIPQSRYVDALLEDLDVDLAAVQDRPLISIFFGGGTPSLFSPDEIDRLLSGVRARLGCSADIEVTLEANPGAIEHGRFSAYRDAGVNRVSLGAQTFSDQRLEALGRIHGAQDVRSAAEELHAAGLSNFNIDLMYALPGQTVAQSLEDVQAALDLAPAHISHYQLTLEPGTVFYHRPPSLPDDDEAWRMQLECQARLASAGYAQYEVSAYARPGRQCRHNLNYWRFGDYLGVGAGAHGKFTIAGGGALSIVRTSRIRQPREYLARAPQLRIERSYISATDLPFEFMVNALRLDEEFAERSFEQRTGLGFDTLRAPVAAAESRGLLQRSGPGAWRVTEFGRRFLNDLQALFLPDEPSPQAAGGRASWGDEPPATAASL